MPTLSTFDGIKISMYGKDTRRHKKPHFHASYAEHKAVFSQNGEIIVGHLPQAQAAKVKVCAQMHNDELKKNWDLLLNMTGWFEINPLVRSHMNP